ncbi:MAG: RidA family protein [Candidatus Tritonobacter lacicola]|nr:RidA family protein [Candidatus Tritonobacter lacicola]
MKKIIKSEKLAPAVGPYSHAVRTGSLVFTSGQIPIDGEGNVVVGGIVEQTKQSLRNLGAVLEAGGLGPSDVVKTTVYMTDLSLFGKMNEVYARFFGDDPPARSTVGVAGLPKGVLVEIEAVASIPEGKY